MFTRGCRICLPAPLHLHCWHSCYLAFQSDKMATTAEPILDLDKWYAYCTAQSERYKSNKPYPHAVVDDFLNRESARVCMEAFPKVEDAGWIHYLHLNEKKHGLNKMDLIPEPLRDAIEVLNSPEFVRSLGVLTGIDGLMSDSTLEGGGLHQTKTGGYLNIHADFTVHPHHRNWRRRVNVLVYLNDPWDESYGGQLELWERDMSACACRISPVFNRSVIFNTDEDSYHGLPESLKCPPGMTRKSIALYYFTEERSAPLKRATNYRARPGDGFKSVLIWLETRAIALYNYIKGWLGISDDAVSKLLNKIFKRK